MHADSSLCSEDMPEGKKQDRRAFYSGSLNGPDESTGLFVAAVAACIMH